MILDLFCLIFLVLSAILLSSTILIAIKRKKSKPDKGAIITPLHILILGFFFTALVIVAPVIYLSSFTEDMLFARIIKSAISAIVYATKAFGFGSDIGTVDAIVMNPDLVNPILGNIYSVYASLLFFGMPLLSAGFILSFFKNVSAYIRYILVRKGEIYYLSELNERSLALAKNLLSADGTKPTVIFFSVKNGDDPKIEEAKKIGAIRFSKDITKIGLKHNTKGLVRKFYLISDNEDKNVKSALVLINNCRNDSAYNTSNTSFYVFSTTIDSEVMLDSADNGEMTVRRVNESKNIALNTLLNEKEIFTNYIDHDGLKVVNALILGGGNLGVELMKALCWCGQLPDYQINIHVVDKDKKIDKKIKALMPELIARSGVYEPGECYYTINTYPDIDVFNSDFVDLLERIGKLSVAFVSLGDDQLNVAASMQLRREMGRLNFNHGNPIPSIYAVVYNIIKNDIIVKNGGLKCLGTNDYGIKFIGDIRTRYSTEVIEHKELEETGMKIHLSWLEHEKEIIREKHEDESEINQKIEESRLSYHKYEYFRRASIATAVHIKVIENLNITFPDKESQGLNEHNRWNAFMRSEGYVFNEKNKDHIARTHTDLKAFKILDKKTQDKDNISYDVANK